MAPRGRPPKRAVAPVEATPYCGTAAQETPPEKRTRPVRTPKPPFEEAAAAENELGEELYKVYYIKNVPFFERCPPVLRYRYRYHPYVYFSKKIHLLFI